MAHPHHTYMEEALSLALKGLGRTAPNPAVGAVVVKDGEIVGRGYHRAAGEAHAEVEALRDAGDKSVGATIYVTLEPCNHHGRTGPCTQAIVDSGITKVVYALPDPHPAAGGGGTWLADRGIEVIAGILEGDARSINEPFFTSVTKGRPFVLLKMAMTLDGHIAERSGKSKYITGHDALRRVHAWRNIYDAVMVGANTALLDDPSLTCRLVEEGRDPLRVTVDSTLGKLTPSLKLFSMLGEGTVVFTTEMAPLHKIKALTETGAAVIPLPASPSGQPSPHAMLEHLRTLGVNSLFLEGGTALATSFILARLVDRLALFYAPKLLLDSAAPLSLGADHPFSLDTLPTLSDKSVEVLGDDVLITGDLEYPAEWP